MPESNPRGVSPARTRTPPRSSGLASAPPSATSWGSTRSSPSIAHLARSQSRPRSWSGLDSGGPNRQHHRAIRTPPSVREVRVTEPRFWRDVHRWGGLPELQHQHFLHLRLCTRRADIMPTGRQPAMRRPDTEMMFVADHDCEQCVVDLAHDTAGYLPSQHAGRHKSTPFARVAYVARTGLTCRRHHRPAIAPHQPTRERVAHVVVDLADLERALDIGATGVLFVRIFFSHAPPRRLQLALGVREIPAPEVKGFHFGTVASEWLMT